MLQPMTAAEKVLNAARHVLMLRASAALGVWRRAISASATQQHLSHASRACETAVAERMAIQAQLRHRDDVEKIRLSALSHEQQLREETHALAHAQHERALAMATADARRFEERATWAEAQLQGLLSDGIGGGGLGRSLSPSRALSPGRARGTADGAAVAAAVAAAAQAQAQLQAQA